MGYNGKDISEDEGREGTILCFGRSLLFLQKFTFRIFHYAVFKAHNKHFIILVCTTISHSTY